MNAEETSRKLNKKIKAADISPEYKAVEINTNGKLSRELAGAVTQADFARERNRIIFGEAETGNIPAQKGDGKPLNRLASPKSEETQNSPTFHQSIREQAQSQFLTENTDIFGENSADIISESQVHLLCLSEQKHFTSRNLELKAVKKKCIRLSLQMKSTPILAQEAIPKIRILMW